MSVKTIVIKNQEQDRENNCDLCRIFGVKCDRCGVVLSPHDLVSLVVILVSTNIIIFITMTITFDVIKVIISVKLHSIPGWSILLCNLPPALITVTVKYINKRTKSLQQLNWNNFSLKRARELDQIAVKSNCHLFLTFIHNPFITCKAMDDFVKL